MDGFISIDPGLNECGYAVFDGSGFLSYCGLIRSKAATNEPLDTRIMAMAEAVHVELGHQPARTVYIEKMFIRRNMQAAWDDLIVLSTIAGAIAGRLSECVFRYVLSNDWTEGRNKAQNHPRIREKLNDEERKAVVVGLVGVPKDNYKEVLDAVGIGLYVANRL